MSDDASEGVTRLTDIVTREVSLVDRGANRRRLLVVKREDEMPENQGLEVNADGTIAEPAPEPAPDPTPADPAPADPAPAPVMKVDGKIKEALLKALAPAVALYGELEKAEAADDAPLSEDVTKGLVDLVGTLADSMPGDETLAESLEKAGRKMAAARLARLVRLTQQITALAEELSPTPKDGEEKPEVQKSAEELIKQAVESAVESAIKPMMGDLVSVSDAVNANAQKISNIAKRAPGSHALDTEGPKDPPKAPPAYTSNRLDDAGSKPIPEERRFD